MKDDLLQWLTQAFTASERDDEGSFEPGSLPVAALDLEEIAEGAAKLARISAGLLADAPSADRLETALIEAEVELEHLLSHWRSLLEQLGLELFAPFSTTDLGLGAASDE